MKAFPAVHDKHFQAGMDLRDYFAAQAMSALIIGDKVSGRDLITLRAYEYADQMMEARKP